MPRLCSLPTIRRQARVFACESNDKRPHATIERRPSRAAVRVSPAPPDQLAVPAQRRGRRHRQAWPLAPRQLPRELRQGSPDLRVETAFAAGAGAQDRQVLWEHEDLELLRVVRSAQQQDQGSARTRSFGHRHWQGCDEGASSGCVPPVAPIATESNPREPSGPRRGRLGATDETASERGEEYSEESSPQSRLNARHETPAHYCVFAGRAAASSSPRGSRPALARSAAASRSFIRACLRPTSPGCRCKPLLPCELEWAKDPDPGSADRCSWLR
jgi:hypothetical protein